MGFFTNHEEVHILREILEEIRKVRKVLYQPTSGTIRFFKNIQGEVAKMPFTLNNAGDQVLAQLQEWTGPNGTGQELAPVGPVSYASDDPAAATVDPSTGVVTAVANGTANITGTDSANGIVGTDSVIVDIAPPPPPVPVSGTILFTPISASAGAVQQGSIATAARLATGAPPLSPAAHAANARAAAVAAAIKAAKK